MKNIALITLSSLYFVSASNSMQSVEFTPYYDTIQKYQHNDDLSFKLLREVNSIDNSIKSIKDLINLPFAKINSIAINCFKNQKRLSFDFLVNSKKIDVNEIYNSRGENLLDISIKKIFSQEKLDDSIKYLALKGANINKHSFKNIPILFQVLEYQTQNYELLEKVARHTIFIGGNVKVISQKDGNSTLMSLLKYQYMSQSTVKELAKLLISKGVNIKHINKEGLNILHFAVRMLPDMSFIKFFVENGVDVNQKSTESETPLHSIALRLHPYSSINYNIIDYLLKNNADINAKNSAGATPLLMFVKFDIECMESIINLMINNGANIKEKDYYEKEILHYYFERFDDMTPQNNSTIELLLNLGANPNATDKSTKTTVLHSACISQNLPKGAITLLIKYGANPFNRNIANETPIDSAKRLSNTTAIEELSVFL